MFIVPQSPFNCSSSEGANYHFAPSELPKDIGVCGCYKHRYVNYPWMLVRMSQVTPFQNIQEMNNRKKSMKLISIIAACLLFPLTAHAQQPLQLKPTPKTVAWGYYDAATPPVMRIKSGDTIEVQTLITSSPTRLEGAGVKPADVEQSLRDIYKEVTNKGTGGQIITGPNFIVSAEM